MRTMCCACDNAGVAKMVQIRNVPEETHRTLKVRAAQAGLSLSDYLLGEVEQLAATPTIAELSERIRRRRPVKLRGSSARFIRRQRGAYPGARALRNDRAIRLDSHRRLPRHEHSLERREEQRAREAEQRDNHKPGVHAIDLERVPGVPDEVADPVARADELGRHDD